MIERIRRLAGRVTVPQRTLGLAGFALLVGLLLWARLIVVTDMPRTAIADPDENAPRPAVVPRPAPSHNERSAPAGARPRTAEPKAGDTAPTGASDALAPRKSRAR